MRLDTASWTQLAAALAVFVGAFGAWGSLSLVEEQAAVVGTTRWILAALAVAAGGLVAVRHRWATFAAMALFVAAGILAWGELRYEARQAFQYGVDGSRWGLWAVEAGAAIGLAAAVLRSRAGPATAQSD